MSLNAGAAIFAAAVMFTLVRGAECTVASTCIRPVPLAAPPSLSMYDTLKMIQCQMKCISEQHIDIELLNANTIWPSYAYSKLSCTAQQKVEQCTLGCMTRHRNPQLTVNRCRDECVTQCEINTDFGHGCTGACRRTFCRYGCSMHDPLQSQSSSTIPAPTNAPAITYHMNSNSTRKLFVTNISNSMPEEVVAGQPQSDPHQNVSYLYRIQAVDSSNNTSYIWQKDLTLPLDLSAFACDRVQVSFSVVTHNMYSEFSPAQSLCVDGVGGWPSIVDENTISVRYTEDTRNTYLGYSVANISWGRPHDAEYLTSYTVYVLTRTQSCGGLNNVLIYNNIGKDATWIVISAHSLNGILMFGCSYTLSVVSMPEQPNQNIPTINISPELIEENPEIIIDCKRLWDERGFMNISVNWSLSNPSPLLAIQRFSIVPLLIDSTQPGLFGRLHEYSRHKINTEEGQMNYRLTLNNFMPQSIHYYNYKIEIRVERGVQYLWRRVPSTASCIISTESEPPSKMTDITIQNIEIEREGVGEEISMTFDMLWSPPSTANGALTQYELVIGTLTAADSTSILYQSTYTEDQMSALINVTFLPNTSLHCLYVRMRSSNGYVWSVWSDSEVISLDSECNSTAINNNNNNNTSSLNDESVTVFYQRAGEEAVRIAEISCTSGLTHTPHTITDKLAILDNKLNAIPNITRVQNSTDNLLERLNNLDYKLDQIINAISQNDTVSSSSSK